MSLVNQPIHYVRRVPSAWYYDYNSTCPLCDSGWLVDEPVFNGTMFTCMYGCNAKFWVYDDTPEGPLALVDDERDGF